MNVQKLKQEISRWESRSSELEARAGQELERSNALEKERRALALAAADGHESAETAMNRKAAEAEEARRRSDNLALMAREAESKLETLRDTLADAQQNELLGALRQACEKRASVVHKLERVARDELIVIMAELKRSADEIAELSAQLKAFDREVVRDLLFRSPLGFVAWAMDHELNRLGEGRLAELQFKPRSGGRERPLGEHQEWACADLLKAAQRSIQGAKLARERARGLIKIEPGERLYRAMHNIIGVRGLNVSPGELVALTPAEAAEFGEALEPAENAA